MRHHSRAILPPARAAFNVIAGGVSCWSPAALGIPQRLGPDNASWWGQFLLKKAASALATLVRAVQSRRLTPDLPQGNSMRGIKS
jgi:hypothetical protein